MFGLIGRLKIGGTLGLVMPVARAWRWARVKPAIISPKMTLAPGSRALTDIRALNDNRKQCSKGVLQSRTLHQGVITDFSMRGRLIPIGSSDVLETAQS